MIPVTSAAATRALDQALIQGLGMPGQVLMEIAGKGAAEQIHRRWPDARVAVLCGPGNNGGDGLVIARWLDLWGHPVSVWLARPPATPDAQANRALLPDTVAVYIGAHADLAAALAGADLAVDALLGTGQRDAPRGSILAGMRAIAAVPRRVAVDIPTGIHSDTGQALCPDPPAFDLTLTIGRNKPGLYCSPGHHLAGEIVLVDIGLDLAVRQGSVQAGIDTAEPDAALLEASDIADWLPLDRPDAAKWNRGHLAIRAGGGAAVLAAHGAFRGGCGLVSLLAPRSEWPALHGLWPEVILAEPDALDPARHDALVIGPGLGRDQDQAVLQAWCQFPGPVLADADALSVLARHGLGTDATAPPAGALRAITPHVAEAARLLNTSPAQVTADRFAAARALSMHAATLLKGPCSLVCASPPTSARPLCWINPTGSVALATAGTGDVLSGLAGAYLARGLSPQHALAVAAWGHGLAGERMVAGGTAGDLVEGLRGILQSSPLDADPNNIGSTYYIDSHAAARLLNWLNAQLHPARLDKTQYKTGISPRHTDRNRLSG